MDIKKFADTLKVTTDVTTKNLRDIQHVYGKAVLKDPETNKEIFAVMYGPSKPDFSKHGIVFNNKGEDDKMYLTLPVPADNSLDDIVFEHMNILAKLSDWEAHMLTLMSEVDEKIQNIKNVSEEV